MSKVVINNCCEFKLSDKAVNILSEIKKYKIDPCGRNIERHDPDLVRIVEDLGAEANGQFASLSVYEFNGNIYRIEAYDGCESVITPNVDWTVIPS